MSDLPNMMRPMSGYAFKSFLVHKPVGVVSSTIDTGPTELIRRKDHPRCGLPKDSIPRQTVYDIAQQAGFPTDCGLVGRLDLDTSGIMVWQQFNYWYILFQDRVWLNVAIDPVNIKFDCQLFSNDTRLADAIRDPPKDGSPLEMSIFKTKEYELRLLSSITYEPEDYFDTSALAEEMSQPFTFQKVLVMVWTNN